MFGFNTNENSNTDKNPLEEMKKMIINDPVIIARMNDQRLMMLAQYEVTKGLTKSKGITIEDVQNKFKIFKAMVKRGSFTLKALEENVYSRWGVMDVPEIHDAHDAPSTAMEETKDAPFGFFMEKKGE